MKKPNLPYLVHRKARGKDYWYFENVEKGRIRLPDPDQPDFLLAYNDAAQRRTRVPVKRNFQRLIEEYKKSQNWSKLKPRTQKDYSKALEYIRDNAGDIDPGKMIRRDVIEAMNANLHRRKFANDLQSMFSVLFEFGINIGWLTTNAAKGVSKLKTGDGHDAWPDALLDAYRAACAPMDLLVMELAICTGQRISDILKMKWNDIEDDGINIKQNKTGTELWVPLTDSLRTLLAKTPKKGFTIVTNASGGQMHYNSAEQRFRVIRNKVGGKGYVMHGWRYTAAHQLVLAGCSDAEIASITGHKSLEMVRKYSTKSAQKRLAVIAQGKRN